jgi:hypothetical protein
MLSMFFSLLAAAAAIGLEYAYRTRTESWLASLWLYVPLMFVVNYSIYRLVTLPGNPLLGALIMWSFATIFLRAGVSVFVLHDRMTPGLWAAVSLMVLARILQGVWK